MEEEYDDEFYIKLLDYIAEKHYLGAGFHWNSSTYYIFYESKTLVKYSWWIEGTHLTGTFTTLKELVEDVLSRFLDVPSRD